MFLLWRLVQFGFIMIAMSTHSAEICRQLLLQAPMLVLMLAGREGRVEMFNDQFAKLFGNRELKDRTMREIWPELEQKNFFELVERVYDTGEEARLEDYAAFVHRDGALVPAWYDFSYQTYHDEAGKTAGVVMFGIDVTERVLARRGLEMSQDRLQFALEAGDIGTFEWIVGSDRVLWTPELEQQYGLEAGAFEGTYDGWADRIHPEDRELAENSVRSAIDGGETMHLEHRIVWPDGQVRWILARAKLVTDVDGKPHKFVGMSMDITDRKELEERLKDANDRITRILEEVLEGPA
jgi:PAS domain S-box-containing protein